MLLPILAAALLLAGSAQCAVELPVLVPGTSCPTSGPINYQYLGAAHDAAAHLFAMLRLYIVRRPEAGSNLMPMPRMHDIAAQ